MQLDINKILEFIFVEFDKNPTEWILFGCLIVLFLVFFVLRLVFFSSKDVVARKGKPSILNSIKNVEEKDLSLPLGFLDTKKSNNVENFNLNSNALDDNANSSVSEYLYLDDNSLIEELTIPRPGDVSSDKKNHSPDKSALETKKDFSTFDQKNIHEQEILDKSILNLSELELIEIERKLIALKELHNANLIAKEIYVLKSREILEDFYNS
ncbi:MAG: hypothetical protein CBE09_05405 [Rhizobiales bacterium TMED249]|nr:MAG: hypothetical protein CBE09_05405 [Rhizobiales bacterium TMED249]HAK98764.1 hypothetical protein [Rhodobiaceae bacterium]|tara:strand:- start:282 stop:914 length:633 start_codon:yes stop_codon:yes gene_type:complete